MNLAMRDIKLAFRSGGGFGLGVAFFMIVVVLVPLAVGPEMKTLSEISHGILWIGALLSCLLTLDRVFAIDLEDGSLDLLATSPLPTEYIIFNKVFVHWVTSLLPLVLASPILGILLGLPIKGFIWVPLSLLVGTPALSAIGVFGAALTLGIKRGAILLSLIILPFYIPTLIFGSELSQRGISGMDIQTVFLILSAISLFSTSLLMFASAYVLRLNLK